MDVIYREGYRERRRERKGGVLIKVLELGGLPAWARPREESALEAEFRLRWGLNYRRLPFKSQFMFLADRDFRFDFCWPNEGPQVEPRQSTGGVALEVQGGIWKAHKGHTGGSGLIRSYDKLNLAQTAGWVVFQFSDKHLKERVWLDRLADCIRARATFYQQGER